MTTIANPAVTLGAQAAGLHLLCPECGELAAITADDHLAAAAVLAYGDRQARHASTSCASCGAEPVALVRVQLLEPIASPFTIAAHTPPPDAELAGLALGPDDERWTITPRGRAQLAAEHAGELEAELARWRADR